MSGSRFSLTLPCCLRIEMSERQKGAPRRPLRMSGKPAQRLPWKMSRYIDQTPACAMDVRKTTMKGVK